MFRKKERTIAAKKDKFYVDALVIKLYCKYKVSIKKFFPDSEEGIRSIYNV